MTLIINPGPYEGRFKDKAVKLIKSGQRVGQCFIGDDDETWKCHVCMTDNPKPEKDGHPDAWQECACGVPFVLRRV